MTQQLEGKVAVVTGGGSGIGRACVLDLAKAGARVVVADIDAAGGAETVERVMQAQGKAIFVQTDVTQADQVKALVEQTVKTFGSIDCAVNNAGIEGRAASMVACTEDNWDRVIDINLKGIWLCMKYQIPRMREQGGGSIVNMASVNGLKTGLMKFAAYTASKHGVIGLTKAAAVEYARSGIRINALCPGYVQTPMLETDSERFANLSSLVNLVPIGRLGTPEEISAGVVWLCSDVTSFMTGQTLVIDGGLLA
jgi:NAD(P)-dependent dehydrogenase (short-subunit alcohol dehydrogenase family)